jgi:hypothetical protein
VSQVYLIVAIAEMAVAALLGFRLAAGPGPERREQIRPGMTAGLASLGACCLAFGAAGPLVLRHLMAPAAASLLHPAQYASAVLAGSGRLPAVSIPFGYVTVTELGSLAATLVLGAALAWGYLRIREPRVDPGPARAAHRLSQRLRRLRHRRHAGGHRRPDPGLTGRRRTGLRRPPTRGAARSGLRGRYIAAIRSRKLR